MWKDNSRNVNLDISNMGDVINEFASFLLKHKAATLLSGGFILLGFIVAVLQMLLTHDANKYIRESSEVQRLEGLNERLLIDIGNASDLITKLRTESVSTDSEKAGLIYKNQTLESRIGELKRQGTLAESLLGYFIESPVSDPYVSEQVFMLAGSDIELENGMKLSYVWSYRTKEFLIDDTSFIPAKGESVIYSNNTDICFFGIQNFLSPTGSGDDGAIMSDAGVLLDTACWALNERP